MLIDANTVKNTNNSYSFKFVLICNCLSPSFTPPPFNLIANATPVGVLKTYPLSFRGVILLAGVSSWLWVLRDVLILFGCTRLATISVFSSLEADFLRWKQKLNSFFSELSSLYHSSLIRNYIYHTACIYCMLYIHFWIAEDFLGRPRLFFSCGGSPLFAHIHVHGHFVQDLHSSPSHIASTIKSMLWTDNHYFWK